MPPNRRLRAVLLPAATLALATLGNGAATPGSASVPAPVRSVLQPCKIPGVAEPLRCGYYTVFEDREAQEGRTLDLNLVVAPARSAHPAPDAVWVLGGGPGQGVADLAPALLPSLERLRKDRDVVLMDQRGTGKSNRLSCQGGFGLLEADRMEELHACRAALERRASLRLYTTPLAVDDMEEVRRALGYPQINLVGASYGTRTAQVYLRRHPASIRSVVLRAMSPMTGNIVFDVTRNADQQLEEVLRDCAADALCAEAYPRLRVELDSITRHLAASPVRVRVAAPSSRDSTELEITSGLFYQTLYSLMLSTPTRQQIPLLVHRAATKGWQSLAAVLASERAASHVAIPVGMYLSVVCTEDAPRITPDQARQLRGGFGGFVAGVPEACAAWPRGQLPVDYHAPLHTDVPVLLLSGAADPATAAESAEAWARSLPNARHVVFPATAHVPLFPGCAADLAARFVAAASPAGLNTACATRLRWPPFAVPTAAAR